MLLDNALVSRITVSLSSCLKVWLPYLFYSRSTMAAHAQSPPDRLLLPGSRTLSPTFVTAARRWIDCATAAMQLRHNSSLLRADRRPATRYPRQCPIHVHPAHLAHPENAPPESRRVSRRKARLVCFGRGGSVYERFMNFDRFMVFEPVHGRFLNFRVL